MCRLDFYDVSAGGWLKHCYNHSIAQKNDIVNMF